MPSTCNVVLFQASCPGTVITKMIEIYIAMLSCYFDICIEKLRSLWYWENHLAVCSVTHLGIEAYGGGHSRNLMLIG